MQETRQISEALHNAILGLYTQSAHCQILVKENILNIYYSFVPTQWDLHSTLILASKSIKIKQNLTIQMTML